MERQTHGFKETLEELDLLVHGVHLGLQLHLIGISCVHILKDAPGIPWSLPVHPRRQQLPQLGCPTQVSGPPLLLEGPMEKERKEHYETLPHQQGWVLLKEGGPARLLSVISVMYEQTLRLQGEPVCHSRLLFTMDRPIQGNIRKAIVLLLPLYSLF